MEGKGDTPSLETMTVSSGTGSIGEGDDVVAEQRAIEAQIEREVEEKKKRGNQPKKPEEGNITNEEAIASTDTPTNTTNSFLSTTDTTVDVASTQSTTIMIGKNTDTFPMANTTPKADTSPRSDATRNADTSTSASKTTTFPSAADLGNCMFAIKWIKFQTTNVPLLCQNENGACPLLAIANILLLRGRLVLPLRAHKLISFHDLIQLISLYLLDQDTHTLTQEQKATREHSIEDAMRMLPKMDQGLDINVIFGGSTKFEFTSALGIFDLFRANLYHGWVVDDQEDAYDALKAISYNHAVELIANSMGEDADLSNENVAKGRLAKEWLNANTSQLTYSGLVSINMEMMEGELAVLFRNNHFSVLYKHKSELLLLVTDAGFQDISSVVWETLNNVEGDTVFLNDAFQTQHAPQQNHNNDHDLQLARKLQEQEDAWLACQSQQHQGPQKQNIQLQQQQDSQQQQPQESVQIDDDKCFHPVPPKRLQKPSDEKKQLEALEEEKCQSETSKHDNQDSAVKMEKNKDVPIADVDGMTMAMTPSTTTSSSTTNAEVPTSSSRTIDQKGASEQQEDQEDQEKIQSHRQSQPLVSQVDQDAEFAKQLMEHEQEMDKKRIMQAQEQAMLLQQPPQQQQQHMHSMHLESDAALANRLAQEEEENYYKQQQQQHQKQHEQVKNENKSNCIIL
eukprot:m.3462 g.3462  ORF g.3462 m.3462 type:complete len:681 (+) comp2073_c0_seq1:87-2129(+)